MNIVASATPPSSEILEISVRSRLGPAVFATGAVRAVPVTILLTMRTAFVK